ncbi:stalk domain-containing protein [Cohnella faecalis]|uniref:Fe/B12 periplasmic-binding domain-containing protein n=1 Tax=Cohnella faecalis TaxID=2315694 RepID=A0A398CQR3_9BACL|nr:stalk domain-containing protein [Cohnella faecalis]RIE04842.1 hypothetical protein D3H35_05085 [Cohnella faecalis]
MNFSTKRLFGLFLAIALVFSIVPLSVAAAKSPITVKLDGKTVEFGVAPQSIGGRTFVPYRALAEKLKATVKWNEAAKKATIVKGSKTIELTIGSKTAKINGKSVTLDAAPVTKSGTTLVPLRFVGESLGLWVTWNAAASTANLESTRTIAHAMGTTKLDHVPERVVVLFNGMVDISVLLGVKPVGAVESYVQQPFYYYLRSSMTGVTVLGDETQPNLEAIVSLKPDIIITTKERHEKIYDQLNKIAPTIMTEKLANWQDNLKIASRIYNKETIADAFLADWKDRVADFKQKIGSRAKNTEVSLIRFNGGTTARAYQAGFAYNIFKELGFSFPKQQVATGKEFITVETLEQVSMLDGDVIFDFTTDWTEDGSITKNQSTWLASPLWKNLGAVKNKKYYKVNVVTWNMSGGAMAAKELLDDLYFYFDLD